MTMTRLWTLIGAVAVVLILAGGYAIGVGPALTAASESDQQIGDVELQNQVKLAELSRLEDLDADSTALFAALGELQLAVPATHNTSEFAAQLASIASASGVVLTRVAYVTPIPAVSPESSPTPVAPVEGSETSDEDQEPVEVAPGSEANTQSVPSVPGLIALGVSIDVEGTDLAVHVFLQKAQEGLRAFSIGTASLAGGQDDGAFQLSIYGNVYVLPTGESPVATVDGETAS